MSLAIRGAAAARLRSASCSTRAPLSTFYGLWFDRVVPVIGRITGESVAYSYLPSSVKRFPGPPALAAAMAAAGLGELQYA